MEETVTIRGHDALIRWTERWLEVWDEYRDEIDEIIDADGIVVAAIRVHGRGRESELEISQRLFHVMELRDRRILRMREYLNRSKPSKPPRCRSRRGARFFRDGAPAHCATAPRKMPLTARPISSRGGSLLNECGHGFRLRDIDRVAGGSLLNG